jgi:hypothetical protein
MIEAHGFDPFTNSLVIRFHGGAERRYLNVGWDLATEFGHAPSKGKFFHQHIKGRFQSEELQAAPKPDAETIAVLQRLSRDDSTTRWFFVAPAEGETRWALCRTAGQGPFRDDGSAHTSESVEWLVALMFLDAAGVQNRAVESLAQRFVADHGGIAAFRSRAFTRGELARWALAEWRRMQPSSEDA